MMRRKVISIPAAVLALAAFIATPSAGRKPLMGWSSWNAFRVNINDSIIRRQAQLLVETGLRDAGYAQVNIDDGFFGPRDSDGNMTSHPKRFPNGMRGITNFIHSLGMKAGIYSDAGDNTCGSMYDADTLGVGAGFYGHELQDARRYFGDWNFDFIKIDYCGAKEQGLVEKEQYGRIADAIRRVKPDASINICRWAFPGVWGRDVAASWRISPDINPSWRRVKPIVSRALNLSAYARDGHYNDMDMLALGFRGSSPIGGPGLTQTEEEAHFGLWCIMSSPLLIGCDLSKIPSSTLDLLKNRELIAINQDKLQLQAYAVVRNPDGSAILVKDIKKRHGLERAAAFYNPGDSALAMSIPLAELEMGGQVAVRDLVHRKDLGRHSGILGFTVPAHGAVIVGLKAERRLDASRYEAEWGYMPMFDDIGRNEVKYAADKACSGGYRAAFLGNHPDNYIEWDNVYSSGAARYLLNISIVNGLGRDIELTVNGESTTLATGASDNGAATVSVPVTLKRGRNSIRMGNSSAYAPDIDKFTLKRL